jgi:hypothetical protein
VRTVISMSQTTASSEPERPAKSSGHRVRAIVNWVVALLTLPAALFVMFVAFAFAMGTDRCASEYCARQGPLYHVFGMLLYGAPLVAVLAVVASFWTARRSWGHPNSVGHVGVFGH